jgi:hypothetical protein
MKLAWSFITQWQNSAVRIKAVINASQFLNIPSNSMWFSKFSRSGYNSREFAKGAN